MKEFQPMTVMPGAIYFLRPVYFLKRHETLSISKLVLFVLFALFLLLGPSGCGSLSYLSKLAWHQGYIAAHSVPVEEILDDEEVENEVKEKVRFIQTVKRYGVDLLGLKKTESYSKLFDIKGSPLHVMTVAEKDRLQLVRWTFPVAGPVTYKGFFSKEDAVREREDFDAKGYDTFLQRAGAYSTLGWLNDPIFSSMLTWNRPALANLILHEMTHTTLYFKGSTEFNEQLATFVGNRGAILFLMDRYGPESSEVEEARHLEEDDLLFSAWVEEAFRRLSQFYARDLSREEKLEGRREIFRSLREDFERIQSQLKTEEYQEVDRVELNNAVILAYRRYVCSLSALDLLYGSLGRDLKRVIDFLKGIQREGQDPVSSIEERVGKEGISAPASQQ